MSDVSVIFKSNDMVLEIADLTNEVTGANINNATATVTITDQSDVEVAGAAFPLTLTYVTDSNGVYRVVLPDTLALEKNQRYIAKINVVNPDGLKGYWEIDVVCKIRK